ncbi:MAG: Fur family transcriptional regulator [Pseudomonadota bacterium]
MNKAAQRISHAERVFDYLKRCGHPASAYGILNGLRGDGVNASTTVYRALQKLVAAGRIHRIESLNAFTVCCSAHDDEAPVFAICADCGSVTEHVDIDVIQSLASLSKRAGFALNHSVLEIHGRCSDCNTGVPDH